MKKGFNAESLQITVEQGLAGEGETSTANMSLYGEIGSGKEIDPSMVVDAIAGLSVDRLNVYYNSMGGDPFSGFAIGNRLSKLQAEGQVKEIHSYAEGIVGSAATIPYLHGSSRYMMNGSRFFIHKGSAFMTIAGTVDTLPSDEEFAQTYTNFRNDLAMTNQQALELYVSKSNLTSEQIEQAMQVTTTYGPKEAVAAGFATHESTSHSVAACITREQALAIHPDLPDEVQELFPTPAEQMENSEEMARTTLAFAELLHPTNWDE